MNTLYIYHHLGLGDHILCNGIVRSYAEKYDKVFLFSKIHNANNVAYMYRDNPKIKIIGLANDDEVKSFLRMFPQNKYLIVGITHEWFRKLDVERVFETVDIGFYIAANVPFEDKWNKFYFERDLEKEKDLFYNKLELKDEEEFLFLHDSPDQGRNFIPSYIPKGYKIIKPGNFKELGFFDFIYTIEKAKEVHCMDSSFLCLIDTMQLKTNKLALHTYTRTDAIFYPKLKLNWTIMNKQ